LKKWGAQGRLIKNHLGARKPQEYWTDPNKTNTWEKCIWKSKNPRGQGNAKKTSRVGDAWGDARPRRVVVRVKKSEKRDAGDRNQADRKVSTRCWPASHGHEKRFAKSNQKITGRGGSKRSKGLKGGASVGGTGRGGDREGSL